MKRWTKLFALSFTGACSLLEAAVAVLAAEIALRILPPQRLSLESLRKHPAPTIGGSGKLPVQESPSHTHAARLAGFVEIADRYLPGTSSCLRRAVALCYSFRWHGVNAALCIGVRREHDTVHAHAWVRTGSGTTFGLAGEPAYAPLSRPAPSTGSCVTRADR